MIALPIAIICAAVFVATALCCYAIVVAPETEEKEDE